MRTARALTVSPSMFCGGGGGGGSAPGGGVCSGGVSALGGGGRLPPGVSTVLFVIIVIYFWNFCFQNGRISKIKRKDLRITSKPTIHELLKQEKGLGCVSALVSVPV